MEPMLRNIVRGLCGKPGGVILVAGAIGVLAGVQHFMKVSVLLPSPATDQKRRNGPGMPRTLNRFTIRRTQSELGYTYWVLQGHGEYTAFALFDTWREAMDEAQRRLKQSPSEELRMAAAV